MSEAAKTTTRESKQWLWRFRQRVFSTVGLLALGTLFGIFVGSEFDGNVRIAILAIALGAALFGVVGNFFATEALQERKPLPKIGNPWDKP